jgi:hypothetical protein
MALHIRAFSMYLLQLQAVGRPHPVFALVAVPVQFRVGFKILDAFSPSGRGLFKMHKRRFQLRTQPAEKKYLAFRKRAVAGPDVELIQPAQIHCGPERRRRGMNRLDLRDAD